MICYNKPIELSHFSEAIVHICHMIVYKIQPKFHAVTWLQDLKRVSFFFPSVLYRMCLNAKRFISRIFKHEFHLIEIIRWIKRCSLFIWMKLVKCRSIEKLKQYWLDLHEYTQCDRDLSSHIEYFSRLNFFFIKINENDIENTNSQTL